MYKFVGLWVQNPEVGRVATVNVYKIKLLMVWYEVNVKIWDVIKVTITVFVVTMTFIPVKLFGMQTEGFPEHWKPFYIVQVLLQPSPLKVFPSSHCYPVYTILFPHVVGFIHTPLLFGVSVGSWHVRHTIALVQVAHPEPQGKQPVGPW